MSYSVSSLSVYCYEIIYTWGRFTQRGERYSPDTREFESLRRQRQMYFYSFVFKQKKKFGKLTCLIKELIFFLNDS